MQAGGADRAQTVNDYAIGIGIFLLTVAFVLSFFPNVVGPFYDFGEDSEPILAERISADLLDRLTQAPEGAPTTLDGTCTVAFFAKTKPGYCGYGSFGTQADDQVYLHDALGVPETLQMRLELLDSSGSVVTLDGTTLALGASSPPEDATTRSRLVYLEGAELALKVVVW